MKHTELKIFSTSQDIGLASRIATAAGIELGRTEFTKFADGELWVKYVDNLRGCDVFIIGATNPPGDNLIELLVMLDAAKRASATRITAVIPYFGYARQDRKDKPRVSISAKLMANLIVTAGAQRVITMDLHTPQIQGFFDIPVDHLYASKVLIEKIKELKIENLMMVSPDVGGIKRARAYAKNLSLNDKVVEVAFIDKRRSKPNEAEVMNIVGDVRSKNLIIVDDLIDTGNSITEGSLALKKAGAKEIIVCATHPLFSNNAIAKLQQGGFSNVFVTNTLRLPTRLPIIKQVDISTVFGEAILNSHLNKSVSSLFLENKD